jgi:thiol-disulfide isomerase/thioredoxin
VPHLDAELTALELAQRRLPALTAVDEASVDPSPPRDRLARLPYSVAIDRSGRVADGYEVQDQPWFVLTSASGQILWYYDVSTQGWPTTRELAAHVRAALARGPVVTTPRAAISSMLAGSPAPLAALHSQAGRLLDSGGLRGRLRVLRGYPAVINAWASWCTPCQQEFPLFASASLRYGRQLAFLGADTDDSTPDARAFLEKHPVSYPSYEMNRGLLAPIATLEGLPTTIFLDRAGRVVYVHTGQYKTLGTLEEDIQTYALQ